MNSVVGAKRVLPGAVGGARKERVVDGMPEENGGPDSYRRAEESCDYHARLNAVQAPKMSRVRRPSLRTDCLVATGTVPFGTAR